MSKKEKKSSSSKMDNVCGEKFSKKNSKAQKELLEKLFGAWKDTDDNLANEVMNAR